VDFGPGVCRGFFWCNNMMLRITCPSCGHAGIAAAEPLPRELRCWNCGVTRYVHSGARIKNPVAVMERILGDARPIDAGGGR
jgi:hypothetical protein